LRLSRSLGILMKGSNMTNLDVSPLRLNVTKLVVFALCLSLLMMISPLTIQGACADVMRLIESGYGLAGVIICTGLAVASGPLAPGVGGGCSWFWVLSATALSLELADEC